MIRFALATLMLLAACGRPLTEGEVAFASTLMGDEIKVEQVRVAKLPLVNQVTVQRPKRPRVACRERIWPEPKDEIVTTFTAAVVLFNRINIASPIYKRDYAAQYPETLDLADAMLFAHEMTHVWQWQNRARTGYHPLKAAREHRPGTDPYLLEFTSGTSFLDFGFEQQGAIVEEYVCCRALDPGGSRTKRLHDMIAAEFPVEALDAHMSRPKVALPWQGAQTRGICS